MFPLVLSKTHFMPDARQVLGPGFFLECLIYGRKDERKQFLEVTEKDASLPVIIFKWNNTRNHHSKDKKNP